jgi:hypothetical protein
VEPIGRMDDGILRVTLEARAAEWRPWGEDGPRILAHVFSVDGAPPRVSGPLLRVTAGTPEPALHRRHDRGPGGRDAAA